jgi:formylmethanofuran dehydrogenase subunit C
MLNKKFKQFGIWMDTKHATVVGVSQNNEADGFKVLAHVKAPGTLPNSNENTFNNDKVRTETMFFKEIAEHLQNAEEVYVTGYGTAQETFSHFLKDTPQFKNVQTMLDTDQQMSDDALVNKVKTKFHG